MKSNLDGLFKASEELEKNGVWFDVVADTTGFLLRPFRPTNPRVKAALAAHYKPYARQVEMGTLDQKKELEIKIKMFIDVCLVDWKGVEIDGKEVECNKENALKLFKSLPDLFTTLQGYAEDFSSFKEDVGNS